MRYNKNYKKEVLIMSQNTPPNLKRRLSASTRKKGEPTKASQQSMAYPKPVSPSGAVNSAKNAR